jgi:pyrroloquinoline-quinone synthase
MRDISPEFQTEVSAPGIISEAIRLLSERPILKRDYFIRLSDGRMARDEFIRTQQQFFFAVQYFSRPIAALVSRCVDSTMRMDLVHNLAEEQGEFRPDEAHDRTFQQFLSLLGVSDVTSLTEEAPVGAFNAALMGACLTADTDGAFACLGFIEFAFADISALIGAAVVKRGWVAPDRLVHYKLHAEIDKRHADEFFAVIEPAWRAGGARRRRIEQGLAFGHYIFGRLYDDLSTS